MTEADQGRSKVANLPDRASIHNGVVGDASEGLAQSSAEIQRAAVKGDVPEDDHAVGLPPEGYVARRVAGGLDDDEVVYRVPFDEGAAHRMAGPGQFVSKLDEKPGWLRRYGGEGAGLHCLPIRLAAPERDPPLGAQDVRSTLVVGVRVRKRMGAQRAAAELAEEPTTRQGDS